MPAYDFICDICGLAFEKNIRFGEDNHIAICPNGHTHVRRIYSAPAVVFKGHGFYSTDNRPKSKDGSAEV